MKKLAMTTRPTKRAKEGSDYLGRNFYLLLVLVPIGWIKIDRNRRKDHGIELISFDLSFASYLGDGASLAFSGFVCSSSLLCEIRVYRRFRGSCKDGEIIKVDRRITSTTNPAGYELSSLHAAGLE
jgi:hypothetical protein